jgi:hypothetical protein
MWKRPFPQHYYHSLTHRNLALGLPSHRPNAPIIPTNNNSPGPRNSAASFQDSLTSRSRNGNINTTSSSSYLASSSSMAEDQYLDLEERLDAAGGSSRGGRGGSKGGRGGGRGESREVAISKALSKLLRHAAGDAGLALDGEGFGRLDKVVSLISLLSFECISSSRGLYYHAVEK